MVERVSRTMRRPGAELLRKQGTLLGERHQCAGGGLAVDTVRDTAAHECALSQSKVDPVMRAPSRTTTFERLGAAHESSSTATIYARSGSTFREYVPSSAVRASHSDPYGQGQTGLDPYDDDRAGRPSGRLTLPLRRVGRTSRAINSVGPSRAEAESPRAEVFP